MSTLSNKNTTKPREAQALEAATLDAAERCPTPTPSEEMELLRICSQSSMDTNASEKPSNDIQMEVGTSAEEQAETRPAAEPANRRIKRKMGGAMKKRYHFFCKQGLSEEEAYEKAKTQWRPVKAKSPKKPSTEGPKGPAQSKLEGGKRNHPDTTISPPEPSKRRKTAGIDPNQNRKPKPTRNVGINAVKIGIFAKSYPERKLTEEDLSQIKQEIEKLIGEQKDRPLKPTFKQLPSRRSSGWIIFHCSNRETADWLKALKLWKDRECNPLEEEDFPKEHTLTGYFLSSADKTSELILAMVQGQNSNLSTANWKILNRIEEKTCLILTIEVDQPSFEGLRELNFWIDFGFGQRVKLNPRKKEKKSDQDPPKQEEAAASTSSATPSTSKSVELPPKTPVHRKGPNHPKTERKGTKGPSKLKR
jgi:Domain of unknown function (DUF4780)